MDVFLEEFSSVGAMIGGSRQVVGLWCSEISRC